MLLKKTKILLGPSTFGEMDPAPKNTLISAGFELIDNPFRRKLSKDELIALLPGVTGLIAGLETLDREVMEKSQLKVISRCGAGMSNVDIKAAQDLGIVVKSTPNAPSTAVAELTLGCLLSLLRQVTQMDSDMHKKKWNKMIGRQLSGMQVAVIGYGNIGQKVGGLLAAFGASVMAVDPRFSKEIGVVPIVDLKYALRNADVLTLHCSGEECLLGSAEFALMKKGSFILNAARGTLIDENALIEALDNKTIAGAWLDTFPSEPYAGALCDRLQVILTPHVGSYSLECRRSMEAEAVDNLISSLKI